MSYYKRAIVGYTPEEQELLDRRDKLMQDRLAAAAAASAEEERSDFSKVAIAAGVIVAGAIGIHFLNRK